jgi:hypothetical protein
VGILILLVCDTTSFVTTVGYITVINGYYYCHYYWLNASFFWLNIVQVVLLKDVICSLGNQILPVVITVDNW